ncbi:MAG: hypothetical protein KAU60_10755 [Desulfobacterales bacterium]|nr:hypothetical protein [Desulfobacterales bacterium]
MSEATRSEACAKLNIRQYSNEVIGEFIADIIVEDTIIVEIKRKVRDFDGDLQDEFRCFNPEYPVNPV